MKKKSKKQDDYGFNKQKNDEGQLKRFYDKNVAKMGGKKIFSRASGKR